MHESAEILAIIISMVGLVVTLGTIWCVGIRRVVRRLDAFEENITHRLEAICR